MSKKLVFCICFPRIPPVGGGQDRRGPIKGVGLRRAATPFGAQPQHVRPLPRRSREGDGVQARRHSQPCPQIPTDADGMCAYARGRCAGVLVCSAPPLSHLLRFLLGIVLVGTLSLLPCAVASCVVSPRLAFSFACPPGWDADGAARYIVVVNASLLVRCLTACLFWSLGGSLSSHYSPDLSQAPLLWWRGSPLMWEGKSIDLSTTHAGPRLDAPAT